MKFRFLPEALMEYEESTFYYSSVSNALAASFVTQIESSIKRIQRNPLAHATVWADVRRCLVKRFPYGIYYIIENDHFLIVAVMHLSRKPGYWENRVSETVSTYE